MGGRDKENLYDSVFLLRWDQNNHTVQTQYLPSLPKSCAHGYATILNNKVYLAGGQSGHGLETAMSNFWVLDLSLYTSYESLPLDKLQNMARQRGLPIASNMSRDLLLTTLQKNDSLISFLPARDLNELKVVASRFNITADNISSDQLIPKIRKRYWGSFQWQELPPWPGPARALNITMTQHNGENDCIYVLSGRRLYNPSDPASFELLTDMYEFNPLRYKQGLTSSEAWRRRAAAPVCMMAGTGGAIGQSHLFIFGGADGSLIHHTDNLKENHPGFPKTSWAFHTITNTWINIGKTPINQVTTNAIPYTDGFVIPSGEIKPRVRTPQIWMTKPIKISRSFGWLNFSVLAIYLLSMLGIGFYFMNRNKDTNDYFRGGQHIPWWAAGCSIFATMLSSITYMSVPAKAYAANWEYLLGYPAIFIMAVFVIYLVLPFFRRIDATSAYEYLEKRFNKLTRMIGSGMFILFQIGRMAIVMFLSALALAAITPFSEVEAILIMGILSVSYSTLGGVEAVIWTDTVQTFVLLGGALLILLITIFSIDGGIVAFFDTALADNKFHMINWEWDLSSYAIPAFWVLILGSLAQNLISYTSDQAVVQRYMTTSNEKLAARSIWSNGILSLFSGLLFFGLGTGLYVFFKTHPIHLDPMIKNDAIMPLFIIQELPVGIAGLIVAGIFAAAQSTISTSMNSTATAAVTDFVRPFSPSKSEQTYLNLGRLFTFIIGIFGTGFAVLLATADIKSLLDQFFAFIGLFGGSLGGLFLLGMFTKRATGRGAVMGAIIGAIVLYLVQAYTATHVYLYAFVGVSTCFITGYLISLVLGGAKSHIDGLTIFTIRDKVSNL
jgi:SSS family transporter